MQFPLNYPHFWGGGEGDSGEERERERESGERDPIIPYGFLTNGEIVSSYEYN